MEGGIVIWTVLGILFGIVLILVISRILKK